MRLAVTLGIAAGLCQIIPPIGAAGAVAALMDGNTNGALYLAGLMLVGGIATVALFSSATMVSHLIAADVMRDQRLKIAAKLNAVPMGFFSNTSPTELRKILVDDVEKLEDGVAHLIPELTAAYVAPLAIFGVMILVDWRLAIAAALPTFGGFIAMSIIMRKSVEATNAFNNAQANIAETMSEVVKAIPVVKTYNNSEAATERANLSINHFHRVVEDFVSFSIVPSNWFFLLASSNLIVVTPVSVLLLSAGYTTLPTVVFFHLGAMSLALIVSGLFGISNRMRQQEGVVARLSTLMQQPDLEVVESGLSPFDASIRFENVHFSYFEKTVIDAVDLSVRAGSSLALVGPSGSGKSTLARLLARFWDPQEGRIFIGNVDLREMTSETLADHVSFVFQDVYLFTRSVADNIRLGKPDASEEEVITAAKAAQAHGFILALPNGYDTIIKGDLGLSKGQEQRISIARALLRDAPILVLDEATAFADPENERKVQLALTSLAANKTRIIIAHRLSTIQNADWIAFVENGRIAEQGNHTTLLALNGRYARQWQAHSEARSFRLSSAGAKP